MASSAESAAVNGQQQRITIENVGPIDGSFPIDLNGPGVYVLRGSKGHGKSTAIACVELLAGHKVNLSLHDGALDGRISGFGSTIPITKARFGKRQGDFEAAALDQEKFSISDITDPGIKDPKLADAHRIKAVASLARAKVAPADFYGLVGGQAEFDKIIRPAELAVDDPVLMVSRIKAAFDAAARSSESLADRAEGQAQSCAASIAGIDLDAPSDAAELAAAVDAAVADVSRLKTLAQESERASKLKADAAARLDKAKAAYAGPTVARAEAMVKQADNDHAVVLGRIADLRAQLQAAEKELIGANARQQQANAALTAARGHAELLSQLDDLIAGGDVAGPSAEEVEAANAALQTARASQEAGVRVRDAKRRIEDGNRHLEEAQAARLRAEQLRDAAKATFDVLMKAVKLDGVRIETVSDVPRLVVDHPRRGRTLFAELSDGERVRATIDLLAPMIGSPGVFPISQRLFQDLPESDIRAIDAYAKTRGLYVFGAQVDDGPLRVERFGPNETTPANAEGAEESARMEMAARHS